MRVFVLALFFCLFGSLYALAADANPPEFGAAILQLFNSIQSKAGAAVVLMAVIQVFKTTPVIGVLGKINQKLLIIVIPVVTALGFIVEAVLSGKSWGAAAVEGLFVSGGAMLIYDAIRKMQAPSA